MPQMTEVLKEINEIHDICNLKEMLILLKETKASLAAARNKEEKLLILVEMSDNLDGQYKNQTLFSVECKRPKEKVSRTKGASNPN